VGDARTSPVRPTLGVVNSSPTFADQPRGIIGATGLLEKLYGSRGKPASAAIGCLGLAFDHSVGGC